MWNTNTKLVGTAIEYRYRGKESTVPDLRTTKRYVTELLNDAVTGHVQNPMGRYLLLIETRHYIMRHHLWHMFKVKDAVDTLNKETYRALLKESKYDMETYCTRIKGALMTEGVKTKPMYYKALKLLFDRNPELRKSFDKILTHSEMHRI